MAARSVTKKPLAPSPVIEPPRWPEHIRVASSGAVEGRISEILGAPHYSYRFAESCFHRMFEHFAVPVTRLPMPEYYATADALAKPGWVDGHIAHLMFRSTEEIRLLKPAYNIACFAWEFDVLADHTFPDTHPFQNQKRMLGLCDEVWVPSSYTRDVLVAHGLNNVHTVPAPIEISASTSRDQLEAMAHLADLTVTPLHINFLLPRHAAEDQCAAREMRLSQWLGTQLQRQPDTKIYLAVLNPEDFRKNIEAMIRGFYYFARERPDRVLIIKTLTSKSRFTLSQVMSDVIKYKLAAGTAIESESIVIFNEYLDDTDLSWLYQLADFYLCTSFAEGQNLPLLEAMRHGTVPVTTRTTAMLDYIDDENAVTIKTRRLPNDLVHLAATSTGKPFDIDWCGHMEVYQALQKSAALTQSRWAMMSAGAARTVKQRFSFERVWSLVGNRFSALARSLSVLAAE